MGSGETIQKAWGTSRELYADDKIEVVEIDIQRGGFSSRHKHLGKCNLFWVLSGELKVTLYHPRTGEKQYEKIVTPKVLPFSVLPGVWHEFEALEPTVCHEVYQAMRGGKIGAGELDIVRAAGSVGGVR